MESVISLKASYCSNG